MLLLGPMTRMHRLVASLLGVVAVQQPGHALSAGRRPEEYACHVPQIGFHILGKEGCGLKLWKDSQREPLTLDYAGAGGTCGYSSLSTEVRKDMWRKLGIKKLQKYQPKPAFFTPQGVRLTKERELTEALDSGGALFVIEGGMFQWPPVDVGFRTVVEGLEVGGQPVELETLAVIPPIFKVHNLALPDETEALIEHSKPHFEKADVVYMDKDKGKDVNEFRTSLNYRPRHNATPLLAKMEARAAQTTRMPFSHLETVQVLYYKTGGYYHAHDDSGQLQFYIGDRRQLQTKHYGYFDRMLTLFWYMNTVPKGGATNFPRAGGREALPVPPSMRKCTQGLMVAPVVGQAVLWYNMHPHGLQTPHALHAACAVEQGEKYAINIWIYNKPYPSPPAEWDPEHPRVKRLEQIAGRKAGTDEALEDPGSNAKSMKFVNIGKSAVQVYWKGSGKLQPMGEPLEPQKETSLQTYVGHEFVAKSGNDVVTTCLVTANGGRVQVCQIANKQEL